MNNITVERAIARHIGVSPSQVRPLNKNKYFVDSNVSAEPLRDARYDFTVEFSQILVGTIAVVNAV